MTIWFAAKILGNDRRLGNCSWVYGIALWVFFFGGGAPCLGTDPAQKREMWWSEVAEDLDQLITLTHGQLADGVRPEYFESVFGTNTTLRLEYARMLLAKTQEQDDPRTIDEAVAQFTLALAESPGHGWAYRDLAWLLAKKAEYAQGEQRQHYLQRALEVIQEGIDAVPQGSASSSSLFDDHERYSALMSKELEPTGLRMSDLTGEVPADYGLSEMNIEAFNRLVYRVETRTPGAADEPDMETLKAQACTPTAGREEKLAYSWTLLAVGYTRNRAELLAEARDLLQQLSAQYGESVEVLSAWALYYASIRKYEKALDLLERVENMAPEHPMLKYVQGEILHMREVYRQAAGFNLGDPRLSQVFQRSLEKLERALEESTLPFTQTRQGE